MSFWSFDKDGDGGAELRIEGEITAEPSLISWFFGMPEAAAPKVIREIKAVDGPLTVWLNSPGGSVVAGSAIYTALRAHPHPVTVKIDGQAASAAATIAMAGDTVLMSPTAMMMIHNPLTAVEGEAKDLERAIQMLDEAKNSILNAYCKKTGLSAEEIGRMMDETTFMSADKAIQLGFADGKLFEDGETPPEASISNMMRSAYTAGAQKRTSDAQILCDLLKSKPDDTRAARLRLARAR